MVEHFRFLGVFRPPIALLSFFRPLAHQNRPQGGIFRPLWNTRLHPDSSSPQFSFCFSYHTSSLTCATWKLFRVFKSNFQLPINSAGAACFRLKPGSCAIVTRFDFSISLKSISRTWFDFSAMWFVRDFVQGQFKEFFTDRSLLV